MAKSRGGGANYGIQADNVQAKAMSFGPGSRAINTEYGSQAEMSIVEAIAEIQAALEQLNVKHSVRDAITAELAKLPPMAKNSDATSKAASEGIVKSVVGKLSAIGVVIKETSLLVDPLTKLIGAMQIARTVAGF